MSYIFLISPNNSGTTIICQYLASQVDGYLPPFGNFEGQMAPAVKDHMTVAPWNPESRYDWDMIRREWDKLLAQSGKSVFIEGSPPNMMRLDTIHNKFGEDARFILSLSGPYLFVPSVIYNYRIAPLTRAGLQKNMPQWLEASAGSWLQRARRIFRWKEKYPEIPFLNYETFCVDPSELNRRLDLPLREIGAVCGKGNSRDRAIHDMTLKNAAFLNEDEIDILNRALEADSGILAAAGYNLISGRDLIGRARATNLYEAGHERRDDWLRRKTILDRHLMRLRRTARGILRG